MIRSALAFAVTTLSFAAPFTAARADDQPRLVPSPVEKVFVPQGFDDNDDTEVVLHGHFPNTCYKVGPVTVDKSSDGRSMTLTAQAYYYSGVGCAQVLVPFVQVARLGMLSEGNFQLKIKDRPEIPVRTLEVTHAQSQSPDDYLYAPVSGATIVTGEDGSAKLQIQGSYPYMFIGCMTIDDVRTSLTADNVVVVQPISSIKDDADCPTDHNFAFSKSLGTLASAEWLIHVRTLDGNALNNVVDLANHDAR